MNVALVFLSALLYAVSFPVPGWWWCAFVALVPFFLALDRAGGWKHRAGLAMCWALGFVAGMGYWLFIALVGHYGVGILTAIGFVVLFVWLPLSVVLIGFCLAYHFFQRPTVGFYGLVLPALWIFIDIVKARLPFLVPWGDIGYSMIPFTRFVQIADIGGIYGVSFLVVMVNGLVAYLIHQKWILPIKQRPAPGRPQHRRRPARRGAWVAAGIILLAVVLPWGYGALRLSGMQDRLTGSGSDKGPAAVIVQGDFELADRWSGMGFSRRLKTYLDMSRVDLKKGRRLIVWPETVLNTSRRLTDDLFVGLMRRIGGQSLLVAGGVHEDPGNGKTYNSAFLISGKGRLLRYDKQILLPYAEAVPVIDLLGPFYDAPEHFAAGRSPVSFQTPLGTFGTSICLEILYPAFVRRSVAEGATVLVNLSNDAWFGRSGMPYLHLNAARMRAIENRRFLLRATNSGISALIGPGGRLLAETDLLKRDRISGHFTPKDQLSVYSRFGQWIRCFAAGVIGVAVLHCLIRRLI
ncbi:MAG: apolipoprotein N-acyltransferase [Thermodesulfobacteriota bacterium]